MRISIMYALTAVMAIVMVGVLTACGNELPSAPRPRSEVNPPLRDSSVFVPLSHPIIRAGGGNGKKLAPSHRK